MNTPPLQNAVRCHACGADNYQLAKQCWMCHSPLGATKKPEPEIIYLAEIVDESHRKMRPSEWIFFGISMLIVVMLTFIGIGIAIDDASMLIPYFIVVCPALLVTLVRVLRKQVIGGMRVGWGERLALFLLSGLVTVSVIVVLIAAAVIALFFACIAALGGLCGPTP